MCLLASDWFLEHQISCWQIWLFPLIHVQILCINPKILSSNKVRNTLHLTFRRDWKRERKTFKREEKLSQNKTQFLTTLSSGQTKTVKWATNKTHYRKKKCVCLHSEWWDLKVKPQKSRSTVYPAWHERASESSAIAGLSQNSPGGQGGHSSSLFSPWEMDRKPVGQGRG